MRSSNTGHKMLDYLSSSSVCSVLFTPITVKAKMNQFVEKAGFFLLYASISSIMPYWFSNQLLYRRIQPIQYTQAYIPLVQFVQELGSAVNGTPYYFSLSSIVFYSPLPQVVSSQNKPKWVTGCLPKILNQFLMFSFVYNSLILHYCSRSSSCCFSGHVTKMRNKAIVGNCLRQLPTCNSSR